jgi:hypothetical protein
MVLYSNMGYFYYDSVSFPETYIYNFSGTAPHNNSLKQVKLFLLEKLLTAELRHFPNIPQYISTHCTNLKSLAKSSQKISFPQYFCKF